MSQMLAEAWKASPRVAGKRALVTGGGRDLGREIAKSLVREGATVFVSDIDADAASVTASEIGAVAGLAHDVTVETTWQRVLDETLRDGAALKERFTKV